MDQFQFLPESYTIETSKDMDKNPILINILQNKEEKSIWICKPGENSNRGRGIRIFHKAEKIIKFLEQKAGEKWILQKYISKPLLLGGQNWNNTPMRKFDIRMYGIA